MGGAHVAFTDPGAVETRLFSPVNATIRLREELVLCKTAIDSELLFTIVSLLFMSTLLFEFEIMSTVARTIPSNVRTHRIMMKHFAYWEKTGSLGGTCA
jgi:hypothetical protein